MKKPRGRIHSSAAVLLVLLAAGILAAALFFGSQWLEEQGKKPESRGDPTIRLQMEPTIQKGGRTYRLRKDVTPLLLVGIDQHKEDKGGFRSGGQADFIRLIVLDQRSRTVSQLALDRDTMTPIFIPNALGTGGRKRQAQLCLAYGMGDGGSQSLRLMKDAVSEFLWELPIASVSALKLEAAAVLNDLVGGVTITIPEDMTKVDPAFVKGATITLTGEQAEAFVRARMSAGNGTNEARMGRQEEYLSQLTSLLMQKMEADGEFLTKMLDALSPYLLTDLSRGESINYLNFIKTYDRAAPVHLPGEHRIGSDGFMEFHPDEKAMEEILLGLFYEEVK